MSQAETSKVVRISLENYKNLLRLKKQMQAQKGEKITYNDLIEQSLKIAELLTSGKEIYAYEDQLFSDVSEVWSHAVEQSLINKTPIQEPRVLIEIGKDDTFEVPK